MTLQQISRYTIACMVLWMSSLASPIPAQDGDLPAPPEAGGDYEARTRGQLHEAFATPTTYDPLEQPIIDKQPPEPIEEVLPDHKPAGENVIWIPGYWDYEQQEDEFIWISGLWRDVPPGRQWVPGYWLEVEGGYRWVPGTWTRAGTDVAFQPRPPKSQERGPSSPAPSAHHFYVPGCWVYQDAGYRWRPGYWAPSQRGWVWVPAGYTAGANGYIYHDGYWDYPLDRRGQLFAPVRFRNRAYATAGYRYRPQVVIHHDTQLMLHLFVRPDRGVYVFGDYYGSSAVPWAEYHRGERGYDPLLVYYRAQYGADFVTRVRGWHKYFVGHPEYRPPHTLAAQQAFAAQHPDFAYLDQAVLGNTLQQVLATSGSADRFVQLGASQLDTLTGITNQIRGLTGERLRLANHVASETLDTATDQRLQLPTETLKLPTLPGIRVPQVGRDIPDIPSNLGDAAPQLPNVVPDTGGAVPTPQLPLNLPGLPF